MEPNSPIRLERSTSIMACSFVALGDLHCRTGLGQRHCRMESHLRMRLHFVIVFSFLSFSFSHSFCVATARFLQYPLWPSLCPCTVVDL